jgi:DNA segregation ATPase FtsK/SpoIIIE-like protein
MDKKKNELEQFKTKLVSLEIRLRRVESFIENMPTPEDYVEPRGDEDLLEEAEKIVTQYDRASASLLQRRLSIGYTKAVKLMDMLEEKGVVSASNDSSEPQDVLIKNVQK